MNRGDDSSGAAIPPRMNEVLSSLAYNLRHQVEAQTGVAAAGPTSMAVTGTGGAVASSSSSRAAASAGTVPTMMMTSAAGTAGHSRVTPRGGLPQQLQQ